MEYTPEQLAKIQARVLQIDAEIEELTEAKQNLLNTLAEAIGDTEKPVLIGSNDLGWSNVTVYTGKMFNADYLKKQAPEVWEKAAEVQLVVTSALAKKNLSEAEYALGQKPNPKRTVKVEAVSE